MFIHWPEDTYFRVLDHAYLGVDVSQKLDRKEIKRRREGTSIV